MKKVINGIAADVRAERRDGSVIQHIKTTKSRSGVNSEET